MSETGWGEFEIGIRIYLVPVANEKPVSTYHHLKLHPYGPKAEEGNATDSPVTSYQYDEILFNEPTEAMFDVLMSRQVVSLPENPKGELLLCNS